MTNRVSYRKMTIEDVPYVHKIECVSFPHPWTEEAFAYEMMDNEYAYYVLAVDEKDNIVGFCGMSMVIDAVQITNVAVLPEVRGLGIGEGLMCEAMRVAKDAQMETMSLEVRVSNEVAQNLYRKLGFLVGGIRKAYYTDNREDAFVMWVKL